MESRSTVTFLDTHIVLWLYDGLTERLSSNAIRQIEQTPLLVSSMVELELHFLKEIGRVKSSPSHILEALSTDIGLQKSHAAFPDIIREARTLTWTRDPFDRIIVGEAMIFRARLVTKDENIRKHCPLAVW